MVSTTLTKIAIFILRAHDMLPDSEPKKDEGR